MRIESCTNFGSIDFSLNVGRVICRDDFVPHQVLVNIKENRVIVEPGKQVCRWCSNTILYISRGL